MGLIVKERTPGGHAKLFVGTRVFPAGKVGDWTDMVVENVVQLLACMVTISSSVAAGTEKLGIFPVAPEAVSAFELVATNRVTAVSVILSVFKHFSYREDKTHTQGRCLAWDQPIHS